MKNNRPLFIVLLIFGISACNAQSVFEKWPAIKTFHEVLSATYHPSENGDLKPIKARYKELAAKAEELAKSDIPADYKTKAVMLATERLQIKTKALLKQIVTHADDATITKLLAEAHDIYHEIVGLCSEEKH